ncbi:geranylgeranyl transferase type-2 subunit beta [Nematocida displodere]|uniref:Geranylgeranyl transferase type II subunit beta n=1 Tax=Nematocida displodere TaxID=1805483 RepID=A0A177ECD9_9MICR|nr:geranylgeranyl transferase type-2 subunit beta [Nematocida displodere]
MTYNKEHREFILRCISQKTRLYYLSEHIRMNTLYWMLNSLKILDEVVLIEELSEGVRKFVCRCQNKDGGFGGNRGYPTTAITTLSAIQILYLLKGNRETYTKYYQKEDAPSPESPKDKRAGEFTIHDHLKEILEEPLHSGINLDESSSGSGSGSDTDTGTGTDTDTGTGTDTDKSTDQASPKKEKELAPNFVLCNAFLETIIVDGKLQGYAYKELDIRTICCYVASKTLLSMLAGSNEQDIFVIVPPVKAILLAYIGSCLNVDGGFGVEPECESHSAHVFCAVSALFLLGEMAFLDPEKSGSFLAWQQKPTGGLSGRIDREEDICHSFWGYSSLMMLEKEHYIDKEKLKAYIVSCESKNGGFSDRPDQPPNLLHTFLSLIALKMIEEKAIIISFPPLALCLCD